MQIIPDETFSETKEKTKFSNFEEPQETKNSLKNRGKLFEKVWRNLDDCYGLSGKLNTTKWKTLYFTRNCLKSEKDSENHKLWSKRYYQEDLEIGIDSKSS